MGRINNLDEDPMVEVMRRLTALERAAPVGFTTVSRGALRIISEEGLIVEGSASISGVLNGDGDLVWDGSITFSGPFDIDGVTVQNGDYTVNGAWHFIGDGDISGDVTMTGVFDLTGNANLSGTVKITGPWNFEGDGQVKGDVVQTGTWTVNAPGQIIIAGDDPITLGAAGAFGVGIGFSTGAVLTSTAQGAALYGPDGDATVTVGPNNASIGFNSNRVWADEDGTRIVGPFFLPDLQTISGVSANLAIDPDTNRIGKV